MISIDLKKKTIFVTGAASFIGSNLVLELFKTQSALTIIGIDNMNDYYDVSIKECRLSEIQKCAEQHPDSTWTFIKGSIADKSLIDSIFYDYKPDIVVNLAAQAGVRYSITNPDVYKNALGVRHQCGQLSVNFRKDEYLPGSEHQCRTRIRGGNRKNDTL